MNEDISSAAMDIEIARWKLRQIAACYDDFTDRGGYTGAYYAGYLLQQELLAQTSLLRELRPELLELIRKGGPAARLRAALLLQSIDFEAGRAELERMIPSDEVIHGLNGCLVYKEWLGTKAAELLGRTDELARPDTAILYRKGPIGVPDEVPPADLNTARAKLRVLATAGHSLPGKAAERRGADILVYRQLIQRPDLLRELQPELERITRHAAPATRILAAWLLEGIDLGSSRAAFEQMLGSSDILWVGPKGWWLGEYAGELLGRPYVDARRLALHAVEHIRIAAKDGLTQSELDLKELSTELKQALWTHHELIARLAFGGEPAMRLRAALMLLQLDHTSARPALEQLARQSNLIWLSPQAGGRHRAVTVGMLARDWLPTALVATLPPLSRPSRWERCPYDSPKRPHVLWKRILEFLLPLLVYAAWVGFATLVNWCRQTLL